MQGIIAGGSPQTVEAGAAMLRRGGNAVDAAVAATFAGFVAEAAISAPGGGGFAIVGGPGRDPAVYDFFCAMPGLGQDRRGPAMDFVRVPIYFEDSIDYFHIGRAASAVPGNIAGLARLLAEAGTLPLGTVLEPAIRLARDGYALSPGQAYLIALVGAPILCYTPGSAAIFAPATVYTGLLGEALVAEHRANGGLVTAEDLAAYRVIKRPALRVRYRDRVVLTNPPPSAGGPLIAYGLRLLARAKLGELVHHDARHVALLAEIMRVCNRARRRDGPAAFADLPRCRAWLDGARLAADWAAVAAALRDGPPLPGPDLPGGPSSTTHVSAIDADGLAVGITTTPGETAGYTVGATGLLMNNILGEADLNPNGFHRWEPGQRLVSMMAPTLVGPATPADGPLVPELVVGSGGSNRLRSAILQLLSNVLDWGMPLDQAVDCARVHFENGLLDLEAGIDPATADALERRGYRLNRWTERSLYFGGTHVVARAADGRLTGAGDARRGGSVAVVE